MLRTCEALKSDASEIVAFASQPLCINYQVMSENPTNRTSIRLQCTESECVVLHIRYSARLRDVYYENPRSWRGPHENLSVAP